MTFLSCETRHCISVKIANDMDNEPEEEFAFALERTSGLHPAIKLDPTAGKIVIATNDGKLE